MIHAKDIAVTQEALRRIREVRLNGGSLLSFDGLEIKSLPGEISEVPHIKQLSAKDCVNLIDLSALNACTHLRHLDLTGCKSLQNLWPIAQCRTLETLTLIGSCGLECLPEACSLPVSHVLLEVFADKLTGAPEELASTSSDDNALPRIRAWQRDLQAGEAESATLKVFLLGNSRVGKTQIRRRLCGERFDEAMSPPHGIERFTFRLCEAIEDIPAFDLQLWDFGGEDSRLGTHALFADKHAIFVLCWSPEYESSKECAQHGAPMDNRPLSWWLSYIRSNADEETPIIVAQTRCDRELDAVDALYVRAHIHGFKRLRQTSASAKRRDGIEQLCLELRGAARYQIERRGKVRLPHNWVRLVSAMLGAQREKCLPRAEFDSMCCSFGIHSSAPVLEYLHRSGQVFWRDGFFDGQVVLDQSWALRGVYAALQRDVVTVIRALAGRFTPELLASLAWREHSELERRHFLRIMQQCRICHRLTEDIYLVPHLLPSRLAVEDHIRHEWRGGSPEAVVRLDDESLHESALRNVFFALAERAGARALYWAYGLCFYDSNDESIVTVSSGLVDAGVGLGGWIRIEASDDAAARCVLSVIESICRVSSGRGGRVTWERGRPSVAFKGADSTPSIVGLSRTWALANNVGVGGAEQRLQDAPALIRDGNNLRAWHDSFSRFSNFEDVRQWEVRMKVTGLEGTIDAARGELAGLTQSPVRVLHLSDLHVAADADPAVLRQPLLADLRLLGAEQIDYLVISGDLTNRADPVEFDRVQQFLSLLIEDVGLQAKRCIVVPGNHDLSWEVEVYGWKTKRATEAAKLNSRFVKQQGEGFLVRDPERYPGRFDNFAQFYSKFRQEPYPTAYDKQFGSYLFEDTRLQFIALNSAWEIDEQFPERSGINEAALAGALDDAERKIRQAREQKLLKEREQVLRFAVWHHPITGNGKIEADSFMSQLQNIGVKMCLHGHVHEERAELVGFMDRRRQLYVAGAGSFGAHANDRPEATPRLYNLLEVKRDHSGIRVHTRCMRKPGGSWEGWAVWPGIEPHSKRSYYDIKF